MVTKRNIKKYIKIEFLIKSINAQNLNIIHIGLPKCGSTSLQKNF